MTDFVLKSDIQEITTTLGDVAQSFAGKTVLLTGGRGFLGRYFIAAVAHLNDAVLDQPCRLVVIDNLITAGAGGAALEAPDNVTFIEHDVIELLDWADDVDFVVHAAGIASPFYYRAYPLETLEVAITGTKNMLSLAQRHQARFTFFSSSEIYGDPDAKHVPTPESYRGNVAAQGPRALNLYGSGDQTRTFCYITDAMNGFLRVIARGIPGEAYNIGNPKPEISMLDLIKAMEKALGRDLIYNVIEYPDSYPADEPQRRCPDIKKARLQIGFEPLVALDDGLKRFLGWAGEAYTGDT
jgi:UDP-glucuronate decarboxylase